jgi:hypothetical protein
MIAKSMWSEQSRTVCLGESFAPYPAPLPGCIRTNGKADNRHWLVETEINPDKGASWLEPLKI